MKDFTTPEHITPIVAELCALYTPITDKIVLDALCCNLILQHNHSKNALVIRAGAPLSFHSASHKELLQEVKDYAETAETCAGELDMWQYNEEKRIMCAVRDNLLQKYA